MEAPRLRVGLVLLAAGAIVLGAIVGPTSVWANGDDLKAALDDYEAGRYEKALGELREYVAGNPGSDEVYAVLRDADEKVLLRVLAKQGEHERLMNYLLDKARPAVRARRLDPDEVQGLVDVAVNDDSLDKRRAAGLDLVVAGDGVVPYLFPFLARSDAEVVVNTMFALHRLGTSATFPLIAVLRGDNPRMVRNAAAVLGDIGDAQAVPALLGLAQTTKDDSVRAKALDALKRIGGERALSVAATNAFTRLGERYYRYDPTIVAGFDNVRNLWRWEDGDLARYEVPAYLYPYQMAEQFALDALQLDPGNMRARALLVQTLLAQTIEADVVKAGGGNAPEALAGAYELAKSQGFDAASEALRQSLEYRDWDVAIGAIQLVVDTYGDQDLTTHPLGAALIAPETRVRYAAAIAALYMSPRGHLPNGDKVVSLAARAASERALRQVLVIDDREDTRSRLVMDLAHAGYVTAAVADGAEGVSRAKNSPTLDVVIVRADLGDPRSTIEAKRHTSSIMAIDELLADARTRDVRVLVLVANTDEAKADAVKTFFQDKYGDKIAGFVTVPIDTTVAMETVATAAKAGDLNPDRERANALAQAAGEAFAKTDFTCRAFDLSVAVEPLSTAATEGPTPGVRLAAVHALGNIRAGGADALVKVLKDADDDALKVAAAAALGSVLAVVDGTPEQIQALIDAAAGEGDVAQAALAALGRARGLTSEQRLQVFEAHRLPVAEKAGG